MLCVFHTTQSIKNKKMRKTLFICLSLIALQTQADKYLTKTGKVIFTSKAPLETIEGTNKSVATLLNTDNGSVEFSIQIKSFVFDRQLLQEHFNENYMESDKIPKATFKGSITNKAAINFAKDGEYKAEVSGKMTIHGVDALQFDFSSISVPEGQKLRIVGNLPYNISSPLLFHLAAYGSSIEDMTFMLQNEVVERMVAEPSTSDYGRLSVMLQYRFVMDKLLDVPPTAFEPAPKVDSAIVRMIPRPTPVLQAHDEALLSRVVQQSFGQRRKTLRNNLRGWMTEDELAAVGVDANARPETLSVSDYVRIANVLHEKGEV